MSLTPPTDSQNFFTLGDIDIFTGLDTSSGDGTIYIRDGNLYVEGITDLDRTIINTTDGEFSVLGTNRVSINVSAPVEIDAVGDSYYTTSSGGVLISTTDVASSATLQSAGTCSIQANGDGSLISTVGKALVRSDGTGDSVELFANNAAGRILLNTTSTLNDSINFVSLGGFTTSISKSILLDSSVSVNLATVTAGIPVNIGTATSINTITGDTLITSTGTGNAIELFANNSAGKILLNTTGIAADSINLLSSGGITATTTGDITLNPATLVSIPGLLDVDTANVQTLEINTPTALGLDNGIIYKRFQTPNDIGTGDIVAGKIQESGVFGANGAATTITLDAFASNVDNFYNGWWVLVTSGAGINQVRRIKTYVGSTQIATIYATADSLPEGLDFTTSVTTGDSYELYSSSLSSLFYGETNDEITTATLAEPGFSVQQYQELNSGSHTVNSQVYNNSYTLGAGTTSVTVTIKNHGQVAYNKVRITNSSNLTPAITAGVYKITSVPTADTFTFTALASITSDNASSSTTVTLLNTSNIYTNVISPLDTDFGGINLTGVIESEDISIPRVSTANFTINIAKTYGSYTIHVSNVSDTSGAYSVFVAAGNGTNNSISRLVNCVGGDAEAIDASWTAGQKPVIFHSPAAAAGTPDPIIYRVRILST